MKMLYMSTRCLMKPFSIDFHIKRNLERGIVLSAVLAFNMSNMALTLSLDNIALAQSIVARRTLTGLEPPRVIDNTRYCIFGARAGMYGAELMRTDRGIEGYVAD
jgi:hypothetical protein